MLMDVLLLSNSVNWWTIALETVFVKKTVNVGVIMDGRALIVQCLQLHFTMDIRKFLINMVQSTTASLSQIQVSQDLLLSPSYQWMFILAEMIQAIQLNSAMI